MKKLISIICINIFIFSGFTGIVTAGDYSIEFFSPQIVDKDVNVVPISCPPSDIDYKVLIGIHPDYKSAMTHVTKDLQVQNEFHKAQKNKLLQCRDTYDYIIVTTESFSNAITSSDFIDWKTTLGYSVKIVLKTDDEITSQPGDDLPERIRNFLREYYDEWGIKYVLIIGDHQTIPMRYCYPDPSNHYNGSGNPGSGGEIPTDYYYADLTNSDADSWDKDGDGYYGEYGQDEPDFEADVYVGRIPTSISSRITYSLDKTVMFEQNTGIWKDAALHAGAFYYFTNEGNSGNPAMDAARSLNIIEQDLMGGWTITHFSEQEGLEKSVYNWSALNQNAFIGTWRDGTFGIVNWGSHAYMDRAARKVWSWDDGDGVPESNEITWPDFITDSSNLDDDYPSIVFAIGCLIGTPEKNPYGNLGVDLVTKPDYGSAVTIISSTRTPYGALNWIPESGGADSICYEFNRFMINDSKSVGEAFYNSKYYCTENYGWNLWYEYNNMYIFNLYGDPSLVREGIYVAPHPDLECDGSLDWSKVKPGDTVTGSFTVRNIGDSNSLLNWTIDSYPPWGVWTISPMNGYNLTPEDEPVTVQVEVIAPEDKNSKFEGEIKVVNSDDNNDYDIIPISLSTPKNKPLIFNFNMLGGLFERFLNAFPILQYFFRLIH
ncbi:MAG: hypothetical protein JSW60_05580 [Thermoplasmatales archaeon]|nr:MAG: hypothetical protein JSW60_05580 [Thermoplasmatales archaeon]